MSVYVRKTSLLPKAPLSLPGNLVSNTIIIESASTISIGGTITAADRIELISEANVVLGGSVLGMSGLVDDFIVIARGTVLETYGIVDSGLRFDEVSLRETGFVNIRANVINANFLEIRARKDIAIDVAGNFTLSGFVGGLSGFNPAENVSIRSKNQFIAEGAIIAARQSGFKYDHH